MLTFLLIEFERDDSKENARVYVAPLLLQTWRDQLTMSRNSGYQALVDWWHKGPDLRGCSCLLFSPLLGNSVTFVGAVVN